jgi:hypothetical protein
VNITFASRRLRTKEARARAYQVDPIFNMIHDERRPTQQSSRRAARNLGDRCSTTRVWKRARRRSLRPSRRIVPPAPLVKKRAGSHPKVCNACIKRRTCKVRRDGNDARSPFTLSRVQEEGVRKEERTRETERKTLTCGVCVCS